MRTNWTLAARRALGLRPNEKLPTGPLGPVVAEKVAYYLLPQGPFTSTQYGRLRRRRMRHRLMVVCPCGRLIPTGRVAQHSHSPYREAWQ